MAEYQPFTLMEYVSRSSSVFAGHCLLEIGKRFSQHSKQNIKVDVVQGGFPLVTCTVNGKEKFSRPVSSAFNDYVEASKLLYPTSRTIGLVGHDLCQKLRDILTVRSKKGRQALIDTRIFVPSTTKTGKLRNYPTGQCIYFPYLRDTTIRLYKMLGMMSQAKKVKNDMVLMQALMETFKKIADGEVVIPNTGIPSLIIRQAHNASKSIIQILLEIIAKCMYETQNYEIELREGKLSTDLLSILSSDITLFMSMPRTKNPTVTMFEQMMSSANMNERTTLQRCEPAEITTLQNAMNTLMVDPTANETIIRDAVCAGLFAENMFHIGFDRIVNNMATRPPTIVNKWHVQQVWNYAEDIDIIKNKITDGRMYKSDVVVDRRLVKWFSNMQTAGRQKILKVEAPEPNVSIMQTRSKAARLKTLEDASFNQFTGAKQEDEKTPEMLADELIAKQEGIKIKLEPVEEVTDTAGNGMFAVVLGAAALLYLIS